MSYRTWRDLLPDADVAEVRAPVPAEEAEPAPVAAAPVVAAPVAAAADVPVVPASIEAAADLVPGLKELLDQRKRLESKMDAITGRTPAKEPDPREAKRFPKEEHTAASRLEDRALARRDLELRFARLRTLARKQRESQDAAEREQLAQEARLERVQLRHDARLADERDRAEQRKAFEGARMERQWSGQRLAAERARLVGKSLERGRDASLELARLDANRLKVQARSLGERLDAAHASTHLSALLDRRREQATERKDTDTRLALLEELREAVRGEAPRPRGRAVLPMPKRADAPRTRPEPDPTTLEARWARHRDAVLHPRRGLLDMDARWERARTFTRRGDPEPLRLSAPKALEPDFEDELERRLRRRQERT